MGQTEIRENVTQILRELPPGCRLVAAIKDRSPEEILETVAAGVSILGANYIQEAERLHEIIGNRAEWHFIGHLQKNKVKRAASLFDMIETVDSVELAREIDRRCAEIARVMPVLIEVNSGREPQKAGVFPENTEKLVREISILRGIKVTGLMTMGPRFGQPEESRPYFIATRKLFEEIKNLELPNAEMQYLSMGMTNSYKVALEEGANIVRIGRKIFGERSSNAKANAPDP
jgi:hypothetical protein